ncbi:hypothetical protein GQ42DRAFT_167091 [Ramicandelaber brevisporus]|nr:hypothetical protein GQ42DRAFT_167091 [Ramicandelaber brevisporus]
MTGKPVDGAAKVEPSAAAVTVASSSGRSGFAPRDWDFGADTVVDTGRSVRLTVDQKHRQGYIWSKEPLPNDTWRVEFDMQVSGHGSYLFGDGMAMWATTDRAKQGSVFGSTDYFNGLGLFFDTYANGRHPFNFPWVMGMLGDGKQSYDHSNDGLNQRAADCEGAQFRTTEGPTRVRVTYSKGEFLEVTIRTPFDEEPKHCFTLDKVTLPDNLYLGFTAMTGEVSDNHEIISVVSETLKDPKTPIAHIASSGKVIQKPSGSLMAGVDAGGLLLKLLVFSAFVGVIYFAYQKSQNGGKNNRRF